MSHVTNVSVKITKNLTKKLIIPLLPGHSFDCYNFLISSKGPKPKPNPFLYVKYIREKRSVFSEELFPYTKKDIVNTSYCHLDLYNGILYVFSGIIDLYSSPSRFTTPYCPFCCCSFYLFSY